MESEDNKMHSKEIQALILDVDVHATYQFWMYTQSINTMNLNPIQSNPTPLVGFLWKNIWVLFIYWILRFSLNLLI